MLRYLCIIIESIGSWYGSNKIVIIQGRSTLALGRERDEAATGGVEISVSTGDVVVVPAGVSHRSIDAEDGYRYIGVYPEVSSSPSPQQPG